MKAFLRSYPGWIVFQLAEVAAVILVANLFLGLGLPPTVAWIVVIAMAGGLAVANYTLRRRYLPDDES